MSPRVLQETWKIERSTVVVMSPLVSIMKDQVEELSQGLKAIALRLGDDEGEKQLRSCELFQSGFGAQWIALRVIPNFPPSNRTLLSDS